MLPDAFIAKVLLFCLLALAAGSSPASAQSEAGLIGIVADQNGALVAGAEITILNASGTLERTVVTDAEGFFSFPFLPAGDYVLKIAKDGFDPSEVEDLFVAEGKERRIKIELRVSAISESVKIEDDEEEVERDSERPTRFDRRFFERLPTGGDVYQSAIRLVPGIAPAPVDNRNLGQFSANGQRTNANFFTVDGVPANFGTTNYDFLGQTGSGSIPSTNVQGGYDNLVSAEALQEVRVEALDFAPATGRTPGAAIAFFSRAGSPEYSFSAFENFRSGVFNARDFFDLEKPPHVFNHFGASLGGPLPARKAGSAYGTFFFLAVEGKRFTLPQPAVVAEVPSIEIRKEVASPVAQAVYNAFPLPNEKGGDKPDHLTMNGSAVSSDAAPPAVFARTERFRAAYSDPNRAESYSLRLDHVFNDKIAVFARFNYSPSFSQNRNPANLSALTNSDQITRALTFGSTQNLSGRIANELRFNLSRQDGRTAHDFDGRYGGVLPDKSIFIPNAFEPEKTHFRFSIDGFSDALVFFYGQYARNRMRQLSVADHLTLSFGDHELKFGVDYRELRPTLRAAGYGIDYAFNSPAAITNGVASRVSFYKNPSVSTRVSSVSAFAQDEWRAGSKFTMIYGLRWEINPPPSPAQDDAPLTLERAPDLSERDQTKLKLAPRGTRYYHTNLKNFAPRVGAALDLSGKNDGRFVLRGGFGVFYDLGQSQFNEIASPFEHTNGFAENLILPINTVSFNFFSNGVDRNRRLAVVAAAPDYEQPRTFFWTLAAQIRRGERLFSASYVGGAGRRLQRTLTLNPAKPTESVDGYYSDDFSKIVYIDNAYSSDYHALQLQYSRNLSNGLQSFVNYAWSHSVDDYSSDSNLSAPFLAAAAVGRNRGSSDFDARHVFNAGFSYDLPGLAAGGALGKLLRKWTLGGIFVARAGLPYDVKIAESNALTRDFDERRADLVPGVPLFVDSKSAPTGATLNADAFARPEDASRQGTLGRNVFTGPALWQFDVSLGKRLDLTRKIKLNFRVEVYNAFNRANFGRPEATIFYRADARSVPEDFGAPTRTLARGLSGAEPTGGLSPVFQQGGARALQFSVRLGF